MRPAAWQPCPPGYSARAACKALLPMAQHGTGPSPLTWPREVTVIVPVAPGLGSRKVIFNKKRTDSADNIPTEIIQFHL